MLEPHHCARWLSGRWPSASSKAVVVVANGRCCVFSPNRSLLTHCPPSLPSRLSCSLSGPASADVPTYNPPVQLFPAGHRYLPVSLRFHAGPTSQDSIVVVAFLHPPLPRIDSRHPAHTRWALGLDGRRNAIHAGRSSTAQPSRARAGGVPTSH